MVNSNPETVSTDYDRSDILFFEPLTVEDVLNICDRMQPDGIIVQFGGPCGNETNDSTKLICDLLAKDNVSIKRLAYDKILSKPNKDHFNDYPYFED